MVLIIGLVGEKSAGKTTLAKYLIQTRNMTEIAFADPIKTQAGQVFNLTHEEKFGNRKEVRMERWNGITPRQVFQAWGELLRTDLMHRLFPLNKFLQENKTTLLTSMAKAKALKLIEKGENVIFSDVRFDDEFKLVQELNGVVIGLHRPNAYRVMDWHPSEMGPRDLLRQMNALNLSQFILHNDGSKADLYGKIEDLLK